MASPRSQAKVFHILIALLQKDLRRDVHVALHFLMEKRVMLRLVLDPVCQTRALEWESQQLRLNQDSEQATLHVNINPLNAKDINEDVYMYVPTRAL